MIRRNCFSVHFGENEGYGDCSLSHEKVQLSSQKNTQHLQNLTHVSGEIALIPCRIVPYRTSFSQSESRRNALPENDRSEITAPAIAYRPSDYSDQWPTDDITRLIAASVKFF